MAAVNLKSDVLAKLGLVVVVGSFDEYGDPNTDPQNTIILVMVIPKMAALPLGNSQSTLLRQNCLMAINFLVSLLKKNWNNVTRPTAFVQLLSSFCVMSHYLNSLKGVM